MVVGAAVEENNRGLLIPYTSSLPSLRLTHQQESSCPFLGSVRGGVQRGCADGRRGMPAGSAILTPKSVSSQVRAGAVGGGCAPGHFFGRFSRPHLGALRGRLTVRSLGVPGRPYGLSDGERLRSCSVAVAFSHVAAGAGCSTAGGDRCSPSLGWGASVGVTWVSVRQFLSREHRAGSQVVMLFPAQWRNPFQVLAHWWFASGFLSAIQASAGGMVAGSGLSFRLSSITTPCSEIFIWLSKISGMHHGKGMAR